MTSEDVVEKALADGARDGAITGLGAVVEQQIRESAEAFRRPPPDEEPAPPHP